MHVALVNLLIERYSPTHGGAISNWIYEQTRRLEARGHRVSVLTRTDAGVTYDVGEVAAVAVRERHEWGFSRRAWSRLLQSWRAWDWPYYDAYLRSLRGALEPLNPDAVVCFNDLRTPVYVRQWLPQARVWTRLSNEVPTRQRDRTAMREAHDGFLCVSRYIRDWAVAAHGLAPERCVVLRNGADPHAFAPPSPREPWRPDARPLRVLFVGRINPDKGPDLLVSAVRRLKDAGADLELTIAGSVWWGNDASAEADPYFASLRRELAAARARGLGHVTRDRMPDLYRDHDVVVMPSRWNEPCGQVQLEAMASGCAVVASDRGGIPETLGGGEHGVLFDPDEGGALERILGDLLRRPDEVERLKQAARAGALRHTWDHVADGLLAALDAQPGAVDGSMATGGLDGARVRAPMAGAKI